MRKELFSSDYRFDSICEVVPEFLSKKGIKLVMIEMPLITEDLNKWLKDMDEAHIQVYIYTNDDDSKKVEECANKLHLPYRACGRKPMLNDFNAALYDMGYHNQKDKVAIIGASRFLDIVGGNRAGIMTIFIS